VSESVLVFESGLRPAARGSRLAVYAFLRPRITPPAARVTHLANRARTRTRTRARWPLRFRS